MTCARCPECPGTNPVVPGDGPGRCGIAFVGEKPGREENDKRRPFVGTTGKEFNENWLPMIGLDRGSVYVTNAMKCFYARNVEPPRSLVESCARFHLLAELREVNPELVVLMGSMACSLGEGIDLETHHGFPVATRILGEVYHAFPMYHPSGELYDFNAVIRIKEDFDNLGMYLAGVLEHPVDERTFRWSELCSPEEVRSTLGEEGQFDEIFLDTESSPKGPWSIQFAVGEEDGYVVRSGSGPAVAELRRYLTPRGGDPTYGPLVGVHNLMYDYDVFRRLGISIPVSRMYDTMWDAWNLGDQPQGLKQLAFRLCGMRMKSFEDLVDPYAYDARVNWVMEAMGYAYPKSDQKEVPDGKGGVRPYQPQSMSTKLDRLVLDLSKGQVDFNKRWEGWPEEDKLMTQAAAGLFPSMSIELVPEKEALEYAAKDPVAGMRVRRELLREVEEFREKVRRMPCRG